MIVGFSKYGTGDGASPINYLLDSKREGRENNPPELVRGDPKLTKNLINALDFKFKYTSGVLSFAPNEEITQNMENTIIERFEQVAFSGLQQDQYNILWVRHTHAGHHELHFVTPRVELSTGKSLNTKPPGKNTQNHFDLFRSEINAKYGLADPEDPSRKRDFSQPNHEIHITLKAHRKGEKTQEDIKTTLNSYLSEKAVIGEIRGRNDVLEHIQTLDLNIPRQGKDYITVHDPVSNKRFRMKGTLYERDFTPSRTIETAETGRKRDYSKPSREDSERFARKVDELNQRKAQYHRQRYNVSIQKSDQSINLSSRRPLNCDMHDDNARDTPIHTNNVKRPSKRNTEALSTRKNHRSNQINKVCRQSMPRNTGYKIEILRQSKQRKTVSDSNGTLNHDRTRENTNKRITDITERISRNVQEFTKRVQHHFRNEHSTENTIEIIRRATEEYSRTNQNLTESNRKIDQLGKKLNQTKKRTIKLSR